MGILSSIREKSPPSKLPEIDLLAGPTPAGPALEGKGFQVIAVAAPDWPDNLSSIAFNPDTTQSERRDAVDGIKWCCQIEAREKKNKPELNLLEGIL